jgi:hypothetical protein
MCKQVQYRGRDLTLHDPNHGTSQKSAATALFAWAARCGIAGTGGGLAIDEDAAATADDDTAAARLAAHDRGWLAVDENVFRAFNDGSAAIRRITLTRCRPSADQGVLATACHDFGRAGPFLRRCGKSRDAEEKQAERRKLGSLKFQPKTRG